MTTTALLFGAIGTLTETSDMQRRAFNAAFEEAGLDWHWGPDAYRDMLTDPGGRDRIARYAAEKGRDVNADALHASKVAHFERLARDEGLTLRPGVADLIAEAQSRGMKLGFATTTGPDTVDLIFDGLGEALSRDSFDFVGSRTHVGRGKPAPEIYTIALDALGTPAGQALAIEDTPESAQSAIAAGVRCLGFPGAAAEGRSFGDMEVVHHLTTGLLDPRPAMAG